MERPVAIWLMLLVRLPRGLKISPSSESIGSHFSGKFTREVLKESTWLHQNALGFTAEGILFLSK
jgi:hypothetical protein